MSVPLVYLAGPISEYVGDEDNIWDWRKYVRTELGKHGLAGIAPMRGEEGEPVIGMGGLPRSAPDQHPIKTTNGTLARDLWDVDRCDAMIVQLAGARQISIGTMIELGRSSIREIPRILVMPSWEAAVNPHNYGWVKELCPFWVGDLDGAVEVCYHLFCHDKPLTED